MKFSADPISWVNYPPARRRVWQALILMLLAVIAAGYSATTYLLERYSWNEDGAAAAGIGLLLLTAGSLRVHGVLTPVRWTHRLEHVCVWLLGLIVVLSCGSLVAYLMQWPSLGAAIGGWRGLNAALIGANLAIPLSVIAWLRFGRVFLRHPLRPWRKSIRLIGLGLPIGIAFIIGMALIEFWDWTVGLDLLLGFGNRPYTVWIPKFGFYIIAGCSAWALVVLVGLMCWLHRCATQTDSPC